MEHFSDNFCRTLRKLAIRNEWQYLAFQHWRQHIQPASTSSSKFYYLPFAQLSAVELSADFHAIWNESHAKEAKSAYYVCASVFSRTVFIANVLRQVSTFFMISRFVCSFFLSGIACIYLNCSTKKLHRKCVLQRGFNEEKKKNQSMRRKFLCARHRSAPNASIQHQFGTVAQIQNQITWWGERP